MTVIIDYLGGMVIGGILLVIAMSAMDSAMKRFVNHNADAIVQSNLVATTEIIQEDLWKMGYGVPERQQSQIIQNAQQDQLKYLTYSDSLDTVADTIEYAILPSDTVTFIDTSLTFYEIRRTLKNSQGSSITGQIGTITNNNVFRYFSQSGDSATLNLESKMVEVTLVALNPRIYLSNELLLAVGPVERMIELRKILRESYWRQTRVISKNLRR